MENAYGLDADYFIRLFARELNPDVVRNQTPTCLARVLLRAARTASEQVFAELEFSDLLPKSAEALAGITLSAEGEANTYRMMRGGNWLASIRMNGELPVSQQEAILSAMLASPPADHSAQDLGMVWCACGDGYPARSYGAGFIAALGHCENCEAAKPATPTIKESLTVAEQASAAQSAPAGERETIRAVFLRNGFTVKEGQTDLKPYVYAAAEELLSIARASWQRTQSAGVPDTSELQRVIYNADYNAKRMLDADSFWWSEIATIRVEFERFMRSLAAAPAQPAARQYYYKVNGCPAAGANDGDCICWHDEGTGPHPRAGNEFAWRDKPAAQDQGEVQSK